MKPTNTLSLEKWHHRPPWWRSNGADFSVIVALLSLGMTCIMLAKAHTTCVHKQWRVEQQLAIELLCLTSQQAVALGNSNGADISVIVALLDSSI